MGRNNRFVVALFVSILPFVSCSLDYSQATVAEDLSEKVPETVLIKFTQTLVEQGKIKRILAADRAENFTKSKQTVFEKIHYSEYDANGGLVIEGKADKAVYATDTENAEIFGNIWFKSYEEKTTIFAETLDWKNKEKLLTSKPDAWVKVYKSDGSYIAGKGFATDLKLKQIVFTGGVSGKYIEETDDDSDTGNDGSSQSR